MIQIFVLYAIFLCSVGCQTCVTPATLKKDCMDHYFVTHKCELPTQGAQYKCELDYFVAADDYCTGD